MQKTIYSFILWALAASMFSACDNDLNVAADWKEIAVVYGLLNPTDDVQYIRIQRAYLDEVQGALRFKDESDSLYFDSLVVRITEYRNSIETNTYDLFRIDGNTSGITKDSGLFNTAENYLYRLNAKINRSTFAIDYSYKLTIFNPVTGYLVTSTTVVVGNSEIKAPITNNSDDLIITDNEGFKVVGAYVEGKHARSYDMIMKIRVEEFDPLDTTLKDTLNLDWVMFLGRKTYSLRGFEDATQILPSGNFFSFIASQLDSSKQVKRRLLGFDLLTIGIGEDLYTYMDVNEPAIGIVQKKPEFTNIENGFGIFSSRNVNRIMDKHFEIRTREAMMTSDKTAHLNFVSY